MKRKFLVNFTVLGGNVKMGIRGDIMFLGFRIKNFKSIAEEIFIDFRAEKSLNEHSYILGDANGIKVLPVISIYGANASGKSNIIEAFHVYDRVINSTQPFESFTIKPFIFENGYSQITEIEGYFCDDKNEYRYGFAVDGTKSEIVEEWLFERKLSSKTETKWKALFERTPDTLSGSIIKNAMVETFYKEVVDKNTFLFRTLGKTQLDSFEKINEVYEIAKWLLPEHSPSLKLGQFEYQFYFDYKESLFSAKQFLCEIDPTIQDIEIDYDDKHDRYECYVKRNGITKAFELESDGTKKILAIFYSIDLCLDAGGLSVIDELDCCLHPLLFRRIVRMFHDKEINKKNAQLVFTSHNIILFDAKDFRRDEIWFSEKNEKGYTTVSSLADFEYNEKRVRSDLDYGKHYLSGRFGAVPFMQKGEEH